MDGRPVRSKWIMFWARLAFSLLLINLVLRLLDVSFPLLLDVAMICQIAAFIALDRYTRTLERGVHAGTRSVVG